MNFNIIKPLNFVYKYIKNIVLTYFTNEPYFMLIHAGNNGNYFMHEFSLELIDAKNMFWISNALMCFVFIFRNNIYFYNINKILYYICFFLYNFSLLKVINVVRHFHN